MAELKLINLEKNFGDYKAVRDVNLTVRDGKFVTLLGPSGCGKTTTLRMIAGFTVPTGGSILLDDVPITSVDHGIFLPPEQRDMGMVFQSYAVWPHMNIFQNVAYPLKFKKISKQEMQDKVMRVLSLVKLDGLAERMPDQLSGGQQQRVALARALVMEPKVLLLDEPLSNLDAKLRESMRFEIVELQRRMKITVVYVTHDQAEAMSMSDSIVVLHNGKIQQIGTAPEVYQKPANAFVADFIGMANFIPCTVMEISGETARVKLDDGTENHFLICAVTSTYQKAGEKAMVVVRPEYVEVLPYQGSGGTHAKVLRQTYLGDKSDCLLELGTVQLRANTQTNFLLEPGQDVSISFSQPILLDIEE
ncbi:ABC transporter ATP-binding protein [Patescibacteria group bacterium]|nr:ABC transporter ATP-binding protein [Patescibacteria group bacterium]